jgi:hypothetical protein
MNTDLTKEELDRLENDLNYDTSDDPRVTRLVSMARRTLQAEERLGRAVEALNGAPEFLRDIAKHQLDISSESFVRLEGVARAISSLDSPKDLPPPLPCAPPAHSDAQPEPQFRIWSFEHAAWWAPNSMGYVQDYSKAGTYSLSEALEICTNANDHRLEEAMVPTEKFATRNVLANH